MLSRIVHRGPDDAGRIETDWCSLGMRRLAIVDFAGGRQPFTSADGRIALVFNGEIYNHRALRAELEREGAEFASDHSDTEVLLRLYERRGLDFLGDLVGMFAIAIADFEREELHLIRDRMGERPIYYRENSATGELAFASDFNALREDGERGAVDGESLRWFFGMKAMPDDATIDADIRRIPAGCRLSFRRGGEAEIVRYHRTVRKPTPEGLTEERALEELESRLTDSIRLQLDADAEVGAFLSGGLDSSTVVAMASKYSRYPLRTYCLVYDEEIYNKSSDRRYAQMVADQVGSRHTEVLLTPDLLAAELPKIVRQYGQPNSATMASWFVCRAMHGQIKVALTGDGPDELFGSYFVHRAVAALTRARATGEVEDLAELPDAERAFAERNWESSLAQIYEAFAVFPGAEQELLLRSGLPGRGLPALMAEAESHLTADDLLNRALEYEFAHALSEQILNYVDVLAMAHSIEPRVPFLDHRLVEWIFSLPHEFKNRHGETKYLLKRMAESYLPKDLIYRKKEGFIEPNIHWMKGPLRGFAEDYLLGGDFNRSGFLNRDYALDLVRQFFDSGEFYVGKKVWTLLMFAIWERESGI